MKPDVLLELPIAATPEQVFSAITEQAELSSWWTPHVVAEPTLGSVGEFRFRGGQFVVKMKDYLETGRGRPGQLHA